MRGWRPDHPLSDVARLKHNARNYLYVYIKRGKALKLPCRVCGSTDAKPHHKDYSKPLEADWLCKLHKKEFSP